MKKKKRALTLIEMMIVIFLITMITGVIGYNMKGAMDRGKVFRTKQAIEKLHDLFMLAVGEGTSWRDIQQNPAEILTELELAKNPGQLLLDGWGERFELFLNDREDDIEIVSTQLERHETLQTAPRRDGS
jgi:type II secretory pathway pseudopilin PulG